MLVESCSRAGCYRYTCYHCSACKQPFCMSHLHPRNISARTHVILCDICVQQPNQTYVETLDAQDHRHGLAPSHHRPNKTIRYIRRHPKDYLR